MTLGEKLTKLRKEKGYTQEQLAEILGVSRQSVSKWESDISYPETDKLIKIGELYDCSMDYLLKEKYETREKSDPDNRINLKTLYYERKSKREIRGIPLWHINIGFGRCAKGIFAFGLCSKGVVSVGLLSLGVISFGCLSLGVFAMGSFALGILAAGAVSMGVVALGAVCFGLLAIGALSVGEFSVGALAIGKFFALGDNAEAAIAIGKTQAQGALFEASAVTADNKEEIITLLDKNTPGIFGWIKGIIKLIVRSF